MKVDDIAERMIDLLISLEKHDLAGVAMAVPVFPLAIYLVLYALHGILYLGLVGATLLLISMGLLIPSRVYEHGAAHAVGLLAIILATGVSVNCGAFFTWTAYYLCKEEDPTFALGGVVYTVIGLAAFGLALGCTYVLVKKVEPRLVHAATTIAVGVAVGVLNIVYLPNF